MKHTGKAVPINWINDTEKYILVPRMEKNQVVKKVKRLIKVKGSCYFTQGVSHALIDFIYRAVIKLGLRDRKLIFSRGSVKHERRPTRNSVEICELDWDLGTSIIIPLKRNYRSSARFMIEDREYTLRIMEIIVLSGLLKLIFRDKSTKWRTSMAASIIARGWGELEKEDPPKIYRPD
jgi:hypothetical protein